MSREASVAGIVKKDEHLFFRFEVSPLYQNLGCKACGTAVV
jgi:hypothetical protein